MNHNGIRKVGIVGEGKMGSALLNYLTGFDLELSWACSREADIERIRKQYGKRINRLLEAGIIDINKHLALRQTTISHELYDLNGCDLIMEAIPENEEQKRLLFATLDPLVNQDCIFASNSSSIKPSLISPSSHRQEKFTGLHFFYPIGFKNIVELTVLPETSSRTILKTEAFLNAIQRFFLTLDEKNSFILNKIFLDFQMTAFEIVKKGYCNFRQMDELVKKDLFAFGVFDFMDGVGLDTMLVSIQNYISGYPHKSWYEPLVLQLQEMVGQGKLGMKTGEGFFHYPLDPIQEAEWQDTGAISEHLRQTWFSAVKRFTAQSHLPIGDINFAVKEYFGLLKGPFET